MKIVISLESLATVRVIFISEMELDPVGEVESGPTWSRTSWRGWRDPWRKLRLDVDAYADPSGEGILAVIEATGTEADLKWLLATTEYRWNVDDLLAALGPDPEGTRRGPLADGLQALAPTIPTDHPGVLAHLEAFAAKAEAYPRKEAAKLARLLGWPSLAPLLARLAEDPDLLVRRAVTG